MKFPKQVLEQALVPMMALLVLSACSGIGDGTKLESLSIIPGSNSTGDNSMKLFECVRNQVSAIGTFTEGDLGDYTTRVRWSSSNPAIVRVSNGDEFLPGSDTLVFTNGTLTPVTPGVATISADYVGLHEEIEVTVVELETDAFTVTPTAATMAPGSTALLRVSAKLDGVDRDISSSATFSFLNPNDAVAKVEEIKDSTDAVIGYQAKALAAGGPLTLQASLSGCPDGAGAIKPTTTVQVKPIQSLAMQREFPGLTALVVGTSEMLKVIATFDGGATQDLSTQTKFTLDPVGPLAFAVSAGLTNDLIALVAGGPVSVSASFAPTDFTPVAATGTFQLSTVTATLNSIAVTPATASIAPLATQQFKATGTYDNGARTQDITRHVSWTASDTAESTTSTVAAISQITNSAGLAFSLKNEAGSSIIKATNNNATVTKTATATLTVTAPPAP